MALTSPNTAKVQRIIPNPVKKSLSFDLKITKITCFRTSGGNSHQFELYIESPTVAILSVVILAKMQNSKGHKQALMRQLMSKINTNMSKWPMVCYLDTKNLAVYINKYTSKCW